MGSMHCSRRCRSRRVYRSPRWGLITPRTQRIWRFGFSKAEPAGLLLPFVLQSKSTHVILTNHLERRFARDLPRPFDLVVFFRAPPCFDLRAEPLRLGLTRSGRSVRPVSLFQRS